MRILIISADGFEDSELLNPREACTAAGMQVDIASLARGPIVGKRGCEVEAPLSFHLRAGKAAPTICRLAGQWPSSRYGGHPRQPRQRRRAALSIMALPYGCAA